MNILIFLIILLVLVLSHEFGHFIVAKKSGIRVDEFAFGFPPKLFGIKKGETEYNFNALPLGGYVKIFGENGETEENIKKETIVTEKITEKIVEESNPETGEKILLETETVEEKIETKYESRSFANKPWYIKASVLVAGVAMNFLVAWLLISIGYLSGLPTSVGEAPKGAKIKDQALTITSVGKESPAEKAGLKTGDKIISLKKGDEVVNNLQSEDVINFVRSSQNKNIEVGIIRGQTESKIFVTPEAKEGAVPMIGISMDTIGKISLPIHKAIWEGLKLSWDLSIAMVQGFYHLIVDSFRGKADLSSVAGPVGIVGIVGDAAEFGFIYLLSFTALISLNLAIINLIPFPALDGGRLLFLLIEKIKGSPIKPVVANWVNTIGFGLLMLLMVIITYHDIVKLF